MYGCQDTEWQGQSHWGRFEECKRTGEGVNKITIDKGGGACSLKKRKRRVSTG